jgi:hypothetical protein
LIRLSCFEVSVRLSSVKLGATLAAVAFSHVVGRRQVSGDLSNRGCRSRASDFDCVAVLKPAYGRSERTFVETRISLLDKWQH